MATPTIEWPHKCYAPSEVINLLRLIKSNMYTFDSLRDTERRLLVRDLKSTPFSLQQAISVRGLLSVAAFIAAKRDAPNMLPFFEVYAEHPPLYIVQRACSVFRMPPLFVLTNYLQSIGYTKPNLSKLVDESDLSASTAAAHPPQNNPNNKPNIKPNIKPAIEWAMQHDCESKQCKQQQAEAGQLFETAVIEHLRSLGLEFETQEQLAAKQRETHGAPYATPDILFTKPITIRTNGHEHLVYWLDAKNFMYVPIALDASRVETPLYIPSFMDKSLFDQAKRYQKHFGSGGFIFAGGYMCSDAVLYSTKLDTSDIAELLLLDGSHIITHSPT